MIVARMSDGSMILGLSRENLDRLAKNQPISVSTATHGVPMPEGCPTIVILFGETEQAIVDVLQQNNKPKH